MWHERAAIRLLDEPAGAVELGNARVRFAQLPQAIATNAWTEQGLYEHDFVIPADWGPQTALSSSSEGVMTDTRASPERPARQTDAPGRLLPLQLARWTPLAKIRRNQPPRSDREQTFGQQSRSIARNAVRITGSSAAFTGRFTWTPCRNNSSRAWPSTRARTGRSRWR